MSLCPNCNPSQLIELDLAMDIIRFSGCGFGDSIEDAFSELYGEIYIDGTQAGTHGGLHDANHNESWGIKLFESNFDIYATEQFANILAHELLHHNLPWPVQH